MSVTVAPALGGMVYSHSGQHAQAGENEKREANGGADTGGYVDSRGMVCYGVELARCADNAGEGQEGEVDPAGASPKAMAQSDPESKEKTGNVEYKFEYGYTVAVIECHPAKFWVSSRRKGLVKNPNYSVNNETRDQQGEVVMSTGLLHIYISTFLKIAFAQKDQP